MKEEIVLLMGTWQVESVLGYSVRVVLASLLVRIVIAALKAATSCERAHGFPDELWRCFRGFGLREDTLVDHWHPFVLGLFELSAYPVLMVTGHWSFIGAWLAFKTIAQWKRWTEERTSFNRFLIGNALVLFLSLLWLTRFVTVVKSTGGQL